MRRLENEWSKPNPLDDSSDMHQNAPATGVVLTPPQAESLHATLSVISSSHPVHDNRVFCTDYFLNGIDSPSQNEFIRDSNHIPDGREWGMVFTGAESKKAPQISPKIPQKSSDPSKRPVCF